VKGFSGFPKGKTRFTPVPNLFFSELLPYIDNLDELKLTMYCFWRLALKEGDLRYISHHELQMDKVLLDSFKEPGIPALTQALERACARGTLLHVALETTSDEQQHYYFLNTDKGRSAVDSITRGDWTPEINPDKHISVVVERPNIFSLYEQNIGALTPLMADKLLEAEDEFPDMWLREAIRLAVENNARSWSYVDAILKRWQREGKDSQYGKGRPDTEKTRRKYLEYLDS
jgi:DnaD/phage-associated family protein